MADGAAAPVEFNRDVRPILSDKCFACHGPDESHREAELRLDVRDDALADRGGYQAVVPGKPDESELIKRITTDDEDLRMPPGSTGKSLSARDIEVLRVWIAAEGKYQKHWSLIPPQRPDCPRYHRPIWPRNAIDHFVLAELGKQGLPPSPDADRRTLIRRLSFDLLGLPPSPDEVEAFLADTSSDAYERLVDRLLASAHFGERMAVYWLDVVRYADSGGYHSDNERSVWPYRDYVIRAFNENYPFDRFTDRTAGGRPAAQRDHPAEDRLRLQPLAANDGGRRRAAQGVHGQVPGRPRAQHGGRLARHHHGLLRVPQSQVRSRSRCKDFYSLAAFFADVQEKAVGRQDQVALPTPEQEEQLAALEKQLAPLRDEFARSRPDLAEAQAFWEAKSLAALATTSVSLASLTEIAGLPNAVTWRWPRRRNSERRNRKPLWSGSFTAVASEFAAAARANRGEWRSSSTGCGRPSRRRLISISVAPRTVRILPRGNWQDDSGEIVEPATPASLPAPEIHDRQQARLDLARWMVAPDNPAVVAGLREPAVEDVLRAGHRPQAGRLRHAGPWPTHAALLDWLAVEFRDSGWNVKHTIKQMVMSRTYQQSSAASPELRQRDPNNEWLARQRPFRLDAEFVRDNALAVSGLLSAKIGGPSVKPYQPAGYWRILNFPQREWENDQGENSYRRGLYTHWQRTFLAPQPAGLRRTNPRGVHGRATPLQHASASPGPAQRSDLRRSGPGPGWADHRTTAASPPRTASSTRSGKCSLEPRTTRNSRCSAGSRRSIVNSTGNKPTRPSSCCPSATARIQTTSIRPNWPPGRPSPEWC